MQEHKVHKEHGDALEAVKIAVRTKKIVHKGVERGSGAHNIQVLVLTNYAYCVIDKPLRGVIAGKIGKVSHK